MLQEIENIKNPFLRGAAVGCVASAIITMTNGIAIAFTQPQDESAYKSAVYATLLSAVCGGVFGVLSEKTKEREIYPFPISDNLWKGWRNFVVVRKVKESDDITSFYLQPEDKQEIPNYQPGQFLTIKLDIPGQSKPVIRTYSLSDYDRACEYYRISIKRELAPPPLDVPPGIASNFLHDRLQEGSIIQVKPPSGKFVINVNNSLPAVLIGNGVGITPLLAMAKACSQLNPQRHIWLLHEVKDGTHHAFRDEINAIALQNPNLHIHCCYSHPRPEDKGYYQSTGHLDVELIKQAIMPEIKRIYNSTDAEFFICASSPLMKLLLEGLNQRGVSDRRVFVESFNQKAKVISELPIPPANNPNSVEIGFLESGKTLSWSRNDGTKLEFVEESDMS